MAEGRDFTGVTRKRATSWSVAAGDRVAKILISIGGIGTIVAVLLVFAYLVSMVVPLFFPGHVSSTEAFPGGSITPQMSCDWVSMSSDSSAGRSLPTGGCRPSAWTTARPCRTSAPRNRD